jgi:hypothetical protein
MEYKKGLHRVLKKRECDADVACSWSESCGSLAICELRMCAQKHY